MELCWSSVAFGIRISSRLQSDRSQRLQGLGRRSSEAAVRLALTMTFSSLGYYRAARPLTKLGCAARSAGEGSSVARTRRWWAEMEGEREGSNEGIEVI